MSVKKVCSLRTLVIVLAFSLSISVCTSIPSSSYWDGQEELKSVEQVGQIPEAFTEIIRTNTFKGASAFSGCLLKARTFNEGAKNHRVIHMVRMMDLYGNDLAVYACVSDDAHLLSTLTATEDGGFLFVLGFSERFFHDQRVWTSESGIASRVIKCDKDGELQFDTQLDGIDGDALQFCFEKNGLFYLFGTNQPLETRKRGVYSFTDVYAAVLDQNGGLVNSGCIAGSDFDELMSAELIDGRFVLSIRSQSDDGDFAGSDSGGFPVDWVITLNDDLEIVEKRRESGRDCFDIRLGDLDGTPVYCSSSLLSGFDAGRPTAVIDYGDFTMIVSENHTGIRESPPAVSATWYYTETVYSAYDDNGSLLFRASRPNRSYY